MRLFVGKTECEISPRSTVMVHKHFDTNSRQGGAWGGGGGGGSTRMDSYSLELIYVHVHLYAMG